jgi:hypothetical protein
MKTHKGTDLTVSQRIDLLSNWGGACGYCGIELYYATCILDHFIPWSIVHNYKPCNYVPSCSQCNQLKLDKLYVSLEHARRSLCSDSRRVTPSNCVYLYGPFSRFKTPFLDTPSSFNPTNAIPRDLLDS